MSIHITLLSKHSATMGQQSEWLKLKLKQQKCKKDKERQRLKHKKDKERQQQKLKKNKDKQKRQQLKLKKDKERQQLKRKKDKERLQLKRKKDKKNTREEQVATSGITPLSLEDVYISMFEMHAEWLRNGCHFLGPQSRCPPPGADA